METSAVIPAIMTAIHWFVNKTSACSCSCPADLRELEWLLSNFDSSRALLEWRLGFSTLLVVAGVILELAVVPFEYRDDWQEYRKSFAEWIQGFVPRPQKPVPWIVFFEVLGAVLVAVGVTGELRYEERIRCVDNQIRLAEEARSGLLEAQTVEAKTLADKADLKRTELANRMLDIFGPRQLNKAQEARIAGRLADLKGMKIDVYAFALPSPYTPGDTKESLNIARSVVRSLRAAHIDAEGWILGSCTDGGAFNLVMSVSPSAPPLQQATDREIASRIIKAFSPEIGTYPEIWEYPPSMACAKFSDLDEARPNKGKHDAAISITIGRKIAPPLTREMLEP